MWDSTTNKILLEEQCECGCDSTRCREVGTCQKCVGGNTVEDVCDHDEDSCGCKSCAKCDTTPQWRITEGPTAKCLDDGITLCEKYVTETLQEQECSGSGTGEKCVWVDSDDAPPEDGSNPDSGVIKQTGNTRERCISEKKCEPASSTGQQLCGCMQGACYVCPNCKQCTEPGSKTCEPWCDG
ncbi:MAG: hypothetical protein ACP5E4_04675, partial [Candidatus Aenigmatarchaeota archaeon]